MGRNAKRILALTIRLRVAFYNQKNPIKIFTMILLHRRSCAVSPRLNFDCVVSDVEIYSLSKRGKSCTQLPVRDANPNLVLFLLQLLLYKKLVVVANILIRRPLLQIRHRWRWTQIERKCNAFWCFEAKQPYAWNLGHL